MPEYHIFDSDQLLPTSIPACACDDWENAVETAAQRKGYVVGRIGDADTVVWASPRLDVYRMMSAMVRSFQPHLKDHLQTRCDDIKAQVRVHRMSEVA